MKPAVAPKAFDAAVAHHQAGNLPEAERLYRQVLLAQPGNNHAMYLLAVLIRPSGRDAEAAQLVRRAIAVDPGVADYHLFLGFLLTDVRDLDGAIASFRRALRLRPDAFDALHPLGAALYLKGDRTEAIRVWRQLLAARPEAAQVRNNLATALRETGSLDEAVAEYRLALAARPDLAQTWMNLGHTLREKGDATEAAAAFKRAVELRPDDAETHHHLGHALKDAGRTDDAIPAFQRALTLRPDHAAALAGLGGALYASGRIEGAVACHERLLATADDPKLSGSLLHALYFHPDFSPDRIRREHDVWNRRHAAALAPHSPSFSNDRSPHRRLKVGYVSSDFRLHASSLFTLPLLANHDPSRVEAFCYADVAKPDELTDLHRARCHVWRNITGQSDEQLAATVRADGIDVLVDLSVHSAGNRLLAFARKPAPVQVTWLGYPGTTGLSTMDCRLSDAYLDPPDATDDRWYSEKTVRLPHSFWCYDPLTDDPPVNPLPALETGRVTFGCLNSYAKVSTPILEAWRRLLARLPTARLLLFAPPGSGRTRALDALGADPARVSFVDRAPRTGYLRGYHRIDVALDTWPYPGGTTTLDALWMGVPVVSLTGSTAMSRAGLSILSNLGGAGWAVDTAERYVQVASELAADLPRLAQLRSSLRQRLRASPLMDAPRFAREIESAYRSMWRAWCAAPSSAQVPDGR